MSIVYEASDNGHWRFMYQEKNKLLGSHNLNNNEELVATIKDVGVETVLDIETKQKKSIPVLHFVGGIPPMAINITNARSIASIYGDNRNDWVGKSIQIFATSVRAFGNTTKALRIREQIPTSDKEIQDAEERLKKCASLDELKTVFMSMPKHHQAKLNMLKNNLKTELK